MKEIASVRKTWQGVIFSREGIGFNMYLACSLLPLFYLVLSFIQLCLVLIFDAVTQVSFPLSSC